MQSPKDQDGGSALILALIAVFLLLLVSFEVAHTSRIEGFITHNIEDEIRMEVACRAGLEKALAVLREDRQQTEIDSQLEAWWTLISDGDLVGTDIGEEEFLFDEDEADYGYGDDDAELELLVRIFDESAKFNIYQLRTEEPDELRKRKERLANVIDRFREDTDFDLSFSEGRDIADQIHSFLYRSQDRPYGDVTKPPTKDPATLTDVSELLYVNNITPEILWDLTDDDRENVIPGLFRFITIWSDQQININTGELPALSGLFQSENAFLAERILEYRSEVEEERERTDGYLSESDGSFGDREGEEEDPTGGAPFTQINELKEKVEGMSDVVYNEINRFVTVQSPVFSVYVTAKRSFTRKTKMWVVRRSDIGFQILYERIVDFPFYLPPEDLDAARENRADLEQGF